ncbi:MAG TPA: GNAT family N-acetyltransferase [Nocardioidaceae bacterium]|nr:GNAT family N-acetyltransferase [Nocardioidaceae bacterium]
MGGVLLYDGECGFCTASARWLERHARGTTRVQAWQRGDLAELGVSAEQCAEAVQWVGNGRRASGPEALAAYLQSGTGAWRAAGRLLATPAAQRLTRPAYRRLVRHRARLSAPATDGSRPPVKGIRRRRPKDVPACARLLRLVYAERQYPVYWPEAPRAFLADDEVIAAWVAERHGEMLGHVAISRVGLDPASAMRWREITGRSPSELGGVSRLFVRPKAAGEGIGSALLEVAVAEIRARGLLPVLEVVTASRDAIALYEARGWRLVGMYDWGHRADRLRILYYTAPPAPVGSAG